MKKQKAYKSSIPIFIVISGGLLPIIAAVFMAIQSSLASPSPVPGHVDETNPEIPRVSLDDTC